jgi:hypothetical protein
MINSPHPLSPLHTRQREGEVGETWEESEKQRDIQREGQPERGGERDRLKREM